MQADHIHMIAEASDKVGLSRGMAGLSIRLARAINRVVGRKGNVFGDRYHARVLASPREVRHGLVYVLLNRRKHGFVDPEAEGIDPRSSGHWFDGWKCHPERKIRRVRSPKIPFRFNPRATG